MVPSSKSISQRYLNLALLERMELLIRRPLMSEDILHYLGAFEALGFGVERSASEVRIVPGPPPAGGLRSVHPVQILERGRRK